MLDSDRELSGMSPATNAGARSISAFESYLKKKKKRNKRKLDAKLKLLKGLPISSTACLDSDSAEDVKYKMAHNGSIQKRKPYLRKPIKIPHRIGGKDWGSAGVSGTRKVGSNRENLVRALQSSGAKQKLARKLMHPVGDMKLKKPKIKPKQMKMDTSPDETNEAEGEEGSPPGMLVEGDDSEYTTDNDVEEDSEDDDTKDSVNQGLITFRWLISPCNEEKFFTDVWEQRPLHVSNRSEDYFKNLLTTQMIDTILRRNYLQFTKNIDVTSYFNFQRQTHNPPGRATPSLVWDFYNKGCSIRMLNPQTFAPQLGILNASLQEFFGCFVGANAYLTPPNSQGFAPHYDDIEAFVLQLEGEKHWKLYQPRSEREQLPRTSSSNFSQDEIGSPVLEMTLKAGEVLYFPRGWIHQASTKDRHSLHITVSCYQRVTWGDLLEKLMPVTVAQAIEENREFREGLPIGYLSTMGVAHSDRNTPDRKAFLTHLKYLMDKLMEYAPVDAAVDQMGMDFMHDALPPILTEDEKKRSVSGAEMTFVSDGRISMSSKLTKDCKVKLVRAHVLRLVSEDDSTDTVHVYHCVANSKQYHETEPQMFEVTLDQAEAIEHLQHVYPRYIRVARLPVRSMEQKMELVNTMWMRGLLLRKKGSH